MIAWFEITSDNISALGEMAEKWGIHPLAVEDCIHRDQLPKLEDFENNQFLVWSMMVQEKIYWGFQAKRTNRYIKKLTLLASVAVLITFWASFWGMNFETIPYSNIYLFSFALGIMFLLVILTVQFLVKKGYWSD